MLDCDLLIIGAGPAGMAAAARAAERGLSVVVLDEQPRPGGQIWRDVERAAPLRGNILGGDYIAGLPHAQGLRHPRITHVAGSTAWQIDPSGEVAYSQDGIGQVARGRRILLATGALERPMPLPGWTLPGVMTAGAAQILLKSSGLVAHGAVLAGCGPLLYLVAAQMVRAGTPPLGVVETQTPFDMARAMWHLPRALIGWRYLAKGARLLGELRRAGIPRYRGATDLAVVGTDHVTAIRFRHKGREHQIDCQTVLLHHGVTPNTQATRSLHLAHSWDDRQRCFRPETDCWGRSSLPNIFIAGDGAGIGGAQAAALTGTLAALAIAQDLGRLSSGDADLATRPLRLRLSIERAARAFLDTAYPPFAKALLPDDDTIVCRCEEVTAGSIRKMAAAGCIGPNQTKAFGRVGMGPCQGRYCGLGVTEILSAFHGQTQSRTGGYRIRPPLKPVTLQEIAAMDIGPIEQSEHP